MRIAIEAYLSFVGADSIAPGRQETESGLAALYIEYSPVMVSRPFGADAS